MRKLLTILLLIPIIAFGQGINTRNDHNLDAVVYNTIKSSNDSIFIIGVGGQLGVSGIIIHSTSFQGGNPIFQFYNQPSTFYYGSGKSIFRNENIVKPYISFNENSSQFELNYIEITKAGAVLNDIRLPFDSSQSIRVKDIVALNSQDNRHAFYGGYQQDYNFRGYFYILDDQLDSIHFSSYSDPNLDLEFSCHKHLENGNTIIGGRKYDWMFPEHDDDIHHTYVMEVDSAGNIQWEWTDPENWTYMPYSISNTSDGGVIMGRTKAVVNQTGGNNGRCVITKLSDLHEIDWEYPIGEYTESIGVMVNSITGVDKVNDTTFVFSGTYNSWGAVDGFLIKITESGNVLWRREFRPEIEASQPQTTVLYDMTPTSDGGYVMVGESRDPEGDGAYQQGWLVKTNCLGYFAPPSAACYAGNADNFEMVFYNNSLNGGEFEWDFGDGQSFTSGEGDTVNHTYAGAGPYNVRLIAKGCNGEADTIYFDVNPSVASIDEATEHGEGTFDLYPNPAKDRVYVSINLPFESLPSATSGRTFEIVDINGKVYQTIPVYKNTYTQEVNISNLPKGIYFVNLFNDKGVIKSRKLVVQ